MSGPNCSRGGCRCGGDHPSSQYAWSYRSSDATVPGCAPPMGAALAGPAVVPMPSAEPDEALAGLCAPAAASTCRRTGRPARRGTGRDPGDRDSTSWQHGDRPDAGPLARGRAAPTRSSINHFRHDRCACRVESPGGCPAPRRLYSLAVPEPPTVGGHEPTTAEHVGGIGGRDDRGPHRCRHFTRRSRRSRPRRSPGHPHRCADRRWHGSDHALTCSTAARRHRRTSVPGGLSVVGGATSVTLRSSTG